MRLCSIAGCQAPHLAKGFCRAHYLRAWRGGDPTTDRRGKHFRTHGDTASPEFKAWVDMRQRCGNPFAREYPYYGARGIRVCERWSRYENFLADMGRRPSAKHSIDRINNDGNYEPSNCRWATKSEQARNRRPAGTVKGKDNANGL